MLQEGIAKYIDEGIIVERVDTPAPRDSKSWLQSRVFKQTPLWKLLPCYFSRCWKKWWV